MHVQFNLGKGPVPTVLVEFVLTINYPYNIKLYTTGIHY